MLDRVHLKTLQVEGFRGVNKPVRLDFGDRATVLSASNGRGKSTLLGAIEWALFGDLKFQPAENRTRDELVSLFHPGGRATVQLGLIAKGEEVRVRRTKPLGRMGSHVELADGGPQPLEEEGAEEALFQILGLGFDDFYRAAYLHQDSIRGLLTEEQRDRDEALDRLLGVETIRNILTSIPVKHVDKALEEIEQNEARILDRLAGAGGMAETTRARALKDAQDAGYPEDDLTTGQAQKDAGSLQASLRKVSKKYGAEVQEDLPVETADDIERIARRIRSVTKEIRISVGKESPLDSAVGLLTNLKRRKAELQAAAALSSRTQEDVDAHLKEHGTPEEWAKAGTEANRVVTESEAALHALDAHGRIVEDTLAYIEAVAAVRECPVCGNPIEVKKIVSRLKEVVKKDQAAEVRRLNAAIKEAKSRVSYLEDLGEERKQLLEAAKEAVDGLEALRNSAWEALGNKPMKRDPLPEVEAKEKAINDGLEGLRNANKDREADLQALDDGAERLRALLRFLKAEADAERVRQKSAEGEGGGAKAFEEDKRKLIELRKDLDEIIHALNSLATGRAQNTLARCGPDISHVYAELCNHPYFDGLKIEVGQKAVLGVQRNTYRIEAFSTKGGEKTSASSRLSTAQMNCVALSTYLSLSKVLTHNLGFILLDDPSQNMDAEHKRALARLLKELLPSTQLVIGTHDAEFDGFLRTSLGKEGIAWYDLAWAPREGTSLKPTNGRNG